MSLFTVYITVAILLLLLLLLVAWQQIDGCCHIPLSALTLLAA